MTLLVISPDYASHAQPLVTIAGAWQSAGEEVVVATGPAVAPLVERAQMRHVLLSLSRGSNPGIARPDLQPAGEDARLAAFFSATRDGMIATLRFQAQERSRDLLWQPESVALRTIEIVEQVRPDAILVDHLAFGATLGLRAAGIPYADVVLGHPRQLPVGREIYGVPGAWPDAINVHAEELAGLRSLASGVAAKFTDAYNGALQAVSPQAAPVADAFAAHGEVVLLNYPRALHDDRRTAELPAAHAFLGAVPRREQAEPELSAWLARDSHRPLVLVSLGTFLSARDDVLRVIADGLRNLDVRVALATGSADPGRLGPLPSEWLVGPYLPQLAILEHASGLVTHAGNNSVTEALFRGVPMLALPFSTDQFDGAAAIEQAAFGAALDPNSATPAAIAAAVGLLVAQPHPALARLSNELALRPGPEMARAAVAEWLAPARTVPGRARAWQVTPPA